MNETDKFVVTPKRNSSLVISVRGLIGLMAFFAYFILNGQRANIGITILCIYPKTISSSNLTQNISSAQNASSTQNISSNQSSTINSRNDSRNAIILISYFIGHILTQILGGIIAFKWGTKITLASSILLGSIGTLLTPISTKNEIALVAVRFLIGLVHGVVFPAISTIWVYWCPVAERSRLVSFALSGVHTGNAVVNLIAGVLCETEILGESGWSFVYYIFGIMGVVWSILFWFIYENSPKDHKFISKNEQEYLLDETNEFVDIASEINKQKFPWKSFFISIPLNSIYIANFAFAWGNYFYITKLPAYVEGVLNFNIKEVGQGLSYSFFGTTIIMIFASVISDILLKKNKVGKLALRKILNSLGLFIPMICLIALIFVADVSEIGGIILIIIGIAFNGCVSSGFLVNINDLCGHYSGIVFGISNTFATIPGIVSPFLVDELIKYNRYVGWRNFFIITIVIYFIGGLSFIIFASSNILSWAKMTNNKNENNMESRQGNDTL